VKICRSILSSLAILRFILLLGLIPLQPAYGSETLQLAQAEAPHGKPVAVRGKISVIEDQNLRATTSSGDVLVQLPQNVRMGEVTGVGVFIPAVRGDDG
jgi:hypothetical protein